MAVGSMDTYIIIESATESKSSTTGQMTRTWSTAFTLWAEVVEKQATEANRSEQVTTVDEKSFRVRYASGITTKMRINVPEFSRYYDIMGIAHEGRKHFLLLTGRSNQVNAPS